MLEFFTSKHLFPASGVETYWWLPVVVAFLVSSLSSTGGLSGAFLLLPFQVSFLGFSSPGVTPTNLIFNVVAIPSGVYRYWREKRLVWSIAWATLLGTLPGLFLGAFIRVKYFLKPEAFKLFVGLVLFYISVRLVLNILRKAQNNARSAAGQFHVSRQFFNLRQVGYEFEGEAFRASTWGLMALSFIVGIIGGIYGIGGGAIIGPFLVAVFRLPVHTTAGASLLGTFVSSAAGVLIYATIASQYAGSSVVVAPDWLLGGLFGIGGAAGIYLGARLQRRLSPRLIKLILTTLLLFIAVKYIMDYIASFSR